MVTAPRTGALGVARHLRRSYVLVWTAVGLALLIGVITLAVSLVALDPTLNRASDINDAGQRAAQAMLGEETALRGYLATGEQRFLAADKQARQELVNANADMERLALENDRLASLILAVRLGQAAWIDEWAKPISTIPPQGLPTGPALLRLLDQDRQLFDGYNAAESRLAPAIDQENAMVRADQRTLLVSALLVETGLVGGSFVVTTVQQRKLQRAIVGPVSDIVRVMHLAAAGDLTARVEASGPAELQQIAIGLNVMSEALSDERVVRASREVEASAQADRLAQILRVAREIAGSLNLRYVLRSVGLGARSMTGQDSAHIWLTDETRNALVPAYDSTGPDGVPMNQEAVQFGEEAAGKAAKYGRTTIEEMPSPGGDTSRLAVPMIVGAQVVGVLEVRGGGPAESDQGVLEALDALATHAASAIEAARLHVELERRSETDALTRLPNRHRFDDDLAAECARSLRYGRPLAFVMMDVDHFKTFNDLYGHQRGDEILQEVATVLAHEVRDGDTAYRYGGEEFSVLLRESNAEQGREAAARIRSRIEAAFADRGWANGVTASFGVAEFSETVSTEKRLVEAADRALYQAKHAGRNQVAVASDGRSSAKPIGADGGTLMAVRPLRHAKKSSAS